MYIHYLLYILIIYIRYIFVNSYLKSATVFGVMEGYGYIWPYNTDRFDFAVYSVFVKKSDLSYSRTHDGDEKQHRTYLFDMPDAVL